jgi:hypothetical protein
MSSFFPRHTHTWKVEEPAAFRKLTLNVVEMGVITGVVLRLYRSLALTHGTDSWLYLGGSFALGAIFLFGMVTLHLGNYTVRRWVLRAPVFAVVEMAAEMVTSLALILLHREPVGSGRAELGDWLPMTLSLVYSRLVPIILYALLLAAVVQLMRYLLLRHEHRDHTVSAVHEHQG